MSQTKPVISHIHSIALAQLNSRKRAEQPLGGEAERWANRHGAALADVLAATLPHGSGFDSGVSVDWDLSSVEDERYVFVAPYHVMNDVGYYVGWAEYRLTVTPSFMGINMEIERTATTGDDAECDLEDYVAETVESALTADYQVPREFYAEQ